MRKPLCLERDLHKQSHGEWRVEDRTRIWTVLKVYVRSLNQEYCCGLNVVQQKDTFKPCECDFIWK